MFVATLPRLGQIVKGRSLTMSDLCTTCGDEIDEDQAAVTSLCADCFLLSNALDDDDVWTCPECGEETDKGFFDDWSFGCPHCLS